MILSDFGGSVVAGVRQTGLNSLDTVDLLGFIHTTISRTDRERSGKGKVSIEQNCLIA